MSRTRRTPWYERFEDRVGATESRRWGARLRLGVSIPLHGDGRATRVAEVAPMSQALERLISDAAGALFLGLGVPVRRLKDLAPTASPRMVDPLLTGSVVQARCPRVEGKASVASLLLVSSFDFIASCRPDAETARVSSASSGDWIYVRDWVKELSNQLLGRIINRLGRSGHTFTLGLPMAVTGYALQREVSARDSAPLRFVGGRHEVKLWFSETLPREVEAALDVTSQRPDLVEGGVLLLDDLVLVGAKVL
jgi:hypothetical protein